VINCTIGARLIESGWETYYWKHRNYEVDFVAIGPKGEHYAIEVKSGKVTRDDIKGLRYFCEQFPTFTPCVIAKDTDLVDDNLDALIFSAKNALSICHQNPVIAR